MKDFFRDFISDHPLGFGTALALIVFIAIIVGFSTLYAFITGSIAAWIYNALAPADWIHPTVWMWGFGFLILGGIFKTTVRISKE